MTRWQWLALVLMGIGVFELWAMPYPLNVAICGLAVGTGIGMIILEWIDPLD